MSKTIDGIPDYFTREQYIAIFAACGVEPSQVIELRMAPDGVHALVLARDDNGRVITTRGEPMKHRVFVPVRNQPDDERTKRVSVIQPANLRKAHP